MQAFPHRYVITAAADVVGEVSLEGDRLQTLRSAPPAEFDGPGDRWSPESLLVAAVADCYVLTFRAIAAVAKFPWISQFTHFHLHARLKVPGGTDEDQAARELLARAKHACLVTHSLKADFELDADVEMVSAPASQLTAEPGRVHKRS
jgi:organic hydroperoxide reductase OsmC/OhrA